MLQVEVAEGNATSQDRIESDATGLDQPVQASESANKRKSVVHTDELSDDETYEKKRKEVKVEMPKPKKKKKTWNPGYETKDGRFLIGKWMRHTILYIFFVVAFTYSQMSGRNSERINSYSYMWRRILVDRTANVTDSTTLTSFLKTSIVNEFFVEDVFAKNYAAAGKTGSPYGSALLGTANLRQLRVKASPCHSLHVKLNDQGSISSTECYAPWTEGAEEKSFSRAGAALVDTNGFPFLEHYTAEETLEPEFEGKFGTYHGGGFLAELSSEHAAKIIDDLDKQQFFDPKTRAIFLDFLVYSPDDDIFASCRVAMEFIAGGVVFPTVFVYGFLLDRYPETGSSVKVGLELFVYSVVVGYSIQEYRHFKHQGWARYKSIDWVHLDVLNYLLFLMGAYYKALYLQKFYNYLEADAKLDSTNISVEIRTMATSLEFQDRLAGANGFLLWLKMFKYVLVTRRMMRQGKTLLASFSDVATFGFLFSIVSYAFATGGHLLFKRELDEFSTINSSARTMLRAVFGESLFPRLIDAAGLSGYMYLLIWLVVSKTILLNVVISILHHAYQSVLVQEATKPSLTIYEKILNELAKRREELQKLEDDGAEQRNLKGRKSSLLLMQEDPFADAKRRMGWEVPTEERPWETFGENGTSPPKKKKSFL